ncbi:MULTISPECIES: ATP-binding protein [Prochlorococcus]|uniref:ATP-binding protein n=1 Tax=Prochlorococcus TaxID=1218 RepID=UPI0005337C7A|nr:MULTISPECIES: ATP-binding protein [Prochlorococcus]KGG12615.1 Serine-protein kinase RsbW [Prochlorococcus sp. MIT 0601]
MRSFCWEDFTLPSTLKLAPLIKPLLEPIQCKKTIDRVELGLHEALVNAVLHGNSANPEKIIRVRRVTTPNWLIWQIQDQGCGFPISARVKSLPSELDAESGRGLFLIHQCFDDVRWSRNGNRLQVACKRN